MLFLPARKMPGVSFLKDTVPDGGAEGGVEGASARAESLEDLDDLPNLALATACCIDFATHPLRRAEMPLTGQDRTEAVARWATFPCFNIM